MLLGDHFVPCTGKAVSKPYAPIFTGLEDTFHISVSQKFMVYQFNWQLFFFLGNRLTVYSFSGILYSTKLVLKEVNNFYLKSDKC